MVAVKRTTVNNLAFLNNFLNFSYKTLSKMNDTCSKRGWWTRYSENRLIEVESRILSVIKTTFKTWFVPIGSTVGTDDQIWTIALNKEGKNTPLVMLHGFAAGLGFWCKNFDDIAQDRPVYAIDLLGFGRSSRPTFAKDCETSEKQFVSALEEWRKQVKLDKFILLGHSFGGYLATSYAIEHPDRVRHLILADPWGFSEIPPDFKPSLKFRVLRVLLFPLFYMNPLASVRAAGPFGPYLVWKIRRDIASRYEDTFDDTDVITDYIYQCNSQHPSGEAAFQSHVGYLAWAKNPMIKKYDSIHESLPITVIYGEHSWIDKSPGYELQKQRENMNYIDIKIIPGAGHHLYSDQPAQFNQFVREACALADKDEDKKGMAQSATLLKSQFDYDRIKAFMQVKNANKEMLEQEIEDVVDQAVKEGKVTQS